MGITHWVNSLSPQQLVDATLWYTDARYFGERLADAYKVPFWKVAGIIAAMSTNTGWEDNMKRVEAFLGGKRDSGHFKSVLDKCNRILHARSIDQVDTILNGRKITNFFHNILGDLTRVTVDRWAIRALGIDERVTPKRYSYAEKIYKSQATRLSNKHNITIPPAVLQALVWVGIRENS